MIREARSIVKCDSMIPHFRYPVLYLGCSLCFVCILYMAPVLAEPAERIVVTGSKIPRTLAKTSESITIITAAEIERYQYRNLSEALLSVPGLHVSTSGGLGAQTSVFVRGSESNHVLVMIDGMKVNDPVMGGTFEFSELLLSHVERIEVIRGGHAAHYGSDALGGVIHITTRRSQSATRVSLERGSFNGRRVSLSSGGEGEVDFSLGASYLKTDGESFTPRRLRMGRKEENDGYRDAVLNLNVGFPVADALRVDIRSEYIEKEVEYDSPGIPFESRLPQSSAYTKRSGVLIAGDYFDGFWQPSWQLSRYVRKHNAGFERARGELLDISWNNILSSGKHWSIAIGTESELESLRIEDSLSVQARTRSIYGELHFSPVDSVHLSYGWRNDDADDFSSKRTGHAGLVWQVDDTLTLRADYATAFKAPSLSDRFRSFPAFAFFANPNLRPETNRHWQIGFEQSLQDLQFGTTYFNNRIRALIEADFALGTLINRDGATIEGIESFINWDTSDALSVRLDYSLMSPYDDNHRRLLRRPGRKLSLTTDASLRSGIDFSLRLEYIGKRSDIDRVTFIPVRAGGYTLTYLDIRKKMTQDISLFIGVDNLFDKRYEPVVGYAGRGIELNAGLMADF